MNNLLATLLLMAGLAQLAPAAAQTKPRPAARPTATKAPAHVYSADEVTPCSFDIVTATELIQSRAVYPADFLKTDPHGEVHVEFVVDATGKAHEVGIRQQVGHEPAPVAATAAVIAAVAGLPPLQPALREGRPVAVRMGLTIRYPNPPASKMYTSGPGRVYAYAEQMPQLLTGGGGAAIVAAIQQHLEYPAAARAAGVAGRVYVRFVVGADGKVRDAQVQQSLGHGCDEAALAAVRQLPEFRPGRQNGCPVAVAYTAPLLFGM
jgi:TonB family protein